ncbi:restriction endonuclease [Rahnella aquatilis]|jgi:5-methylcytosine-specific restriction enzyme subunit McrC|uniref:McrC family protein n=1 Tax=Rahnella sp. (strain Y9602) TaxID=2703885 RepID=A0ABW6C5P6_RAHSY|nr:restriction endonuclease [Rahnella aquatilis]AZP48227.1 restriction endonuclease [Rahnella aquatilis]MDP9703073.1 5-methylcytosine-specific restriction enzyme subunit McrC [Rahnella aquatilis]
MLAITVREFARLTTSSIEPTLDRAQISVSAFDYLCRLASSFNGGTGLLQVEDRAWLKLDNHVGVIETPCGTRIEILPKSFMDEDCVIKARRLLRKMIEASFDLPTRHVGEASLELFNAPLSEWVMERFVDSFSSLIKRGLRAHYQRLDEEQFYLKGQINFSAQMRQSPSQQHKFQIRHDIFTFDRAENRLLKLALLRVSKTTQQPRTLRLSQELLSLLNEVTVSTAISRDFSAWRSDRLMSDYQDIKPWCELVLGEHMPTSILGEWRGVSLLFPMEKLFERYVVKWLRRNLPNNAILHAPARSRYLCAHLESSFFRLEPDILIEHEGKTWLLDTKWKRLNSSDRASKYGLSQSDFYQLFAYGNKYLGGQGHMFLIYPLTSTFNRPLADFSFSETLKLSAIPFDIENEELIVEHELLQLFDKSCN